VEQGEARISTTEDYHSHNTTRLDLAGMKALLQKLQFVKALQRGEYVEPEE
jgi:UDP-glucose 4-epimerase